MNHPANRSGYALIMTLLLLAMAAIILVGTARKSVLRALEAQQAVDELQRRWVVQSCRHTLLERAEVALDPEAAYPDRHKQSSKSGLARAQQRLHTRLNEMDYELVFTDEQAKRNLNNLSAAQAIELVKRRGGAPKPSAHDPAQAGPLVRLRPLIGTANSGGGRALRAYGQVLENPDPAKLIGTAKQLGWATDWTCWGTGRVNIRNASDAVVAHVGVDLVGSRLVDALLDARRDEPDAPLSKWLDQLGGLDDKQRNALTGTLTESSDCYGLWVVAHGSGRSWYSLLVGVRSARDPQKPDEPLTWLQQHCFSW